MAESEAQLLFWRLARASFLLESLQEECLEPVELTFVEYTVLRVLDDGPKSPSRLAEYVVRTTGGMTKIVDRLQRRGLVHRVPDPDDRRGVLVGLTVEGRELGDKASDAYSVGRDRIIERLRAADRRGMESGLDLLIAAFEDDRRDA
ncbi:MAG: Transcriptional regulator, MarR family [Actinomycetia bacterium]|nr:Transcriptional regulator, MarR family [Actinomycetes bacterium]